MRAIKNLIKSPLDKKVFKITIGSYCADKKIDYSESQNYTSVNVLAIDVNDALYVAGEWLLEEEKEALKGGEGIFVESVELITYVDLFPKD